MSAIINFIQERKIEEVLHFSTNHGLVGIASIGQVISRDQLEVDPENDPQSPLYALNAKNSKFRSDPEWTSYINLSISRINKSFLDFSRNWRKKDPDHYWIILSFKPDILDHQNVFFSTTKNIYHGSCIRRQGIEGLQNCFSNCVVSKHNRPIYRPPNYPSFWTTCPEAEVLYFKSLSLDYLKCIYVEDEGTYDQVVTTLQALIDRTDINVIINKNKFEGQ